MENDPSKKESKGKRILKKAFRRNSKSSNNSNQNSVEHNSSVLRSKSFENKCPGIEINDSASLQTPDASKEKDANCGTSPKFKTDNQNAQEKKYSAEPVYMLEDITENKNETTPVRGAGSKLKTTFDKNNEPVSTGYSSKKSLKRKLEEESGAGTSGASTGASDTDADDKDPSKDKKKKNRCAVCRKKVGLTGFECRCGGLFCAVHRYSDKHECSFDYRELGAQEIRRNNPVVVSQKIHKI